MSPGKDPSFLYKTVANLMAYDLQLPGLVEPEPSLENKLCLLSWLPVAADHPLKNALNTYAFTLCSLAHATLKELRPWWSRAVRNARLQHKHPALIWTTARTHWQIATLAPNISLKGEMPFSWSHTIRQDLSLWCAGLQQNASQSACQHGQAQDSSSNAPFFKIAPSSRGDIL